MVFLANFLNGNKCYLCNLKSELLCDKCFSRLQKVESSERILVNTLNSLYKYNEYSSKILLMAKYPPYYFHILKLLIRKSQLPVFLKDSLFCPVPLSSLKMFERKFNQAELIANELVKYSPGVVFPTLKRIRDSKPLFELNRSARKSEIEGVFRMSLRGSLLPRKDIQNIVLVDDLVTTSETVKDCIRALKLGGFKNIEIFSLFRA